MKCYECTEQLSAYIDNMLTPEEQKDVEMHLKTCPSCQKELDSLRYMLNHIDSLEEAEIPETLHQDIMRAIHKEKKIQRNIIPFKGWMKYVTSAAAAIFLVIILLDANLTGIKNEKISALETPKMMQDEAGEPIAFASEAQAEDNLEAASLPVPESGKEDIVLKRSKMADEVIEEWEILSNEKIKIIEAIKEYISSNGINAEYNPDENNVSEVILYKVPDKEKLFDILKETDNQIEVSKAGQEGENLKIIIK
ncbi:MAG: hypothetical protein K0S71_388 [Clostridia bacterium]|jgi:hypothetical protein|nr:hypothetical protein [Clostridia bacterium]